MNTKTKDRLGIALIIGGLTLPVVTAILTFVAPNPNVAIDIGIFIRTLIGGIVMAGFGGKMRRDVAREEYVKEIKKRYGEDAQVIFR